MNKGKIRIKINKKKMQSNLVLTHDLQIPRGVCRDTKGLPLTPKIDLKIFFLCMFHVPGAPCRE